MPPLFLRLILLVLLVPASCQAWNRAGHMVSGAFVYSLLKRQSPDELAHWTAVLKQHPEYVQRFLPRLEEARGLEFDQCLWMLAARWPDDVRGDPLYDRPDWHYINFAYKPAGQPESVTTVGPADVNIVTAYRTNLEVLRRDATAGQQAVALCWVLHLVGDVHQPLHTTKLFTTEFPAPSGDRGGTLAYIRARPKAEAITLHRFWDDLILGAEDFREARNTAIALRAEFPSDSLPQLKASHTDADFRLWAELESLALAQTQVYREGSILLSSSRKGAAVLPDGYTKDSQRIARRQLALAAWRSAHIIGRLRPSAQ